MEIRFIAHSSFSIHTQGKKIISDPWLSGKVFNDSWAHIATPADVDWSAIDYIWVSHEHPDHFHFPTLKSIPGRDKQHITVLHQRHASERMLEAIGKIGFGKIVELPLYQWVDLEPGIELYCGSVGSMDSFLAVRSEGKCVLNLNDCVLNRGQLRYIKSALGDVDALFTQFSFANWVGNDADEIGGAARKIRQMKEQLLILEPAHLIPFASFVYFCNEENQRMNAWINTPQAIQDLGIPQVHFMYPGDTWNMREDKTASMNALVRYADDYNKPKEIDPTPAAVDAEKLLSAASACMDSFVKRYPLQLRGMPPLTIDISDPGHRTRRLVFSPAATTVVLDDSASTDTPARMQMCSQAAWYMFNFSWGSGTLEVSGMFRDRRLATEGAHPFFYLRNKMSTQFLEFDSLSQSMRTLGFLWRKKWEISYRFMSRDRYLASDY
ncbi:MAG: UDP-MurNAc hydroxylase [Burkholderiales bacterium]